MGVTMFRKGDTYPWTTSSTTITVTCRQSTRPSKLLQGRRGVGDVAEVKDFDSVGLFQVIMRRHDGSLDSKFVHQIVFALGSTNAPIFRDIFDGDLRDSLVGPLSNVKSA